MALVTVDRAQPGMVLAACVTDRKGRRLIPGDVELTERHIQALQMWGVAQVEIVGDTPAEATQTALPPEEEARIRQETDELFGEADRDHPFMSALYEYAVRHAIGGAGTTGGNE